MRRKRPRVAEEDAPEEKFEPLKVYTANGIVSATFILFKVHDLLKAHAHGVGVDVFQKALGVDLRDPRNEAFMKALVSNPLINVETSHGGGIHLTRRHAFGVHNNERLRRLLLVELPEGRAGELDKSGSFGKRVGIKASDLVDTYEGVRQDLTDMVLDRELMVVPCNGGKGELVYFRHPAGVEGSSFLRDLWRSVELPPTEKETLNYLVKVKIREKTEWDRRLAAEKELRDQREDVKKRKAHEAKKAARKQKAEMKAELKAVAKMKSIAHMRRFFGCDD